MINDCIQWIYGHEVLNSLVGQDLERHMDGCWLINQGITKDGIPEAYLVCLDELAIEHCD